MLCPCSPEFTQYMSVSSAQQLSNIDALDAHRDRQQRTLKRNLSSGAPSLVTGWRLQPCSMARRLSLQIHAEWRPFMLHYRVVLCRAVPRKSPGSASCGFGDKTPFSNI